MSKLGRPIAMGSRSIVHARGRDAVAKVPRADTPDAWIHYEATYSDAVRRAGAPAPEFLGFEHHDGRLVSVHRRARGPVMLDILRDDPAAGPTHGRLLAELQLQLTTLVAPVVLPLQIDRVRCKIRRVARGVEPSLGAALDEVPPINIAVLCHGDIHPSNVIYSADGPVIVDWFDAARGDPVADVARTSLLLSTPTTSNARAVHLGDTPPAVVARTRTAYVDAACELFAIEPARLERWRAVMAVARIAEGIDPDDLIVTWVAWRQSGAAPAGISTT